MSSKNYINTDVDFDFGIDFKEHPNEIAASASNTKAKEMYNAIMPLLTNLKMNPDKPTIVWPDREKKIDLFIKKLDNILNS